MQRRRLSSNKIDKIKLNIGQCSDCDKIVTEETLCCFDFDHIVSKGKKINISTIRHRPHLETEFVEEELKKCQLLCCICHYKKTMKQFNYVEITEENSQNVMYNKEKIYSYCKNCNKELSDKNCIFCKECYHKNSRKIERPSYEQLLKEIQELGYIGTGKKYNVTDNAIRKWKKYYEKQ